eukprot:scaffold113194_cov61-Phaeocystis_antarctica.AAC.2
MSALWLPEASSAERQSCWPRKGEATGVRPTGDVGAKAWHAAKSMQEARWAASARRRRPCWMTTGTASFVRRPRGGESGRSPSTNAALARRSARLALVTPGPILRPARTQARLCPALPWPRANAGGGPW